MFYRRDSYYGELACNLSLENTYVSAVLAKSFLENTLKLKVSLMHGYTGTTFSYAIEKQITAHTRVEGCMVIGSMGGVKLNLEVYRGRQTFMVPILLSSEIMPSAIFYGTVTPVIAYYVVKRLIIDPYKREKEARY
jgi:DnaJ family protein C protein 11